MENKKHLRKKKRLPRKLKKKYLKMGIKVIINETIDQEWVDKWNSMITPLELLLENFPLKDDANTYTWYIYGKK